MFAHDGFVGGAIDALIASGNSAEALLLPEKCFPIWCVLPGLIYSIARASVFELAKKKECRSLLNPHRRW
jgi:hypothetical protein